MPGYDLDPRFTSYRTHRHGAVRGRVAKAEGPKGQADEATEREERRFWDWARHVMDCPPCSYVRQPMRDLSEEEQAVAARMLELLLEDRQLSARHRWEIAVQLARRAGVDHKTEEDLDHSWLLLRKLHSLGCVTIHCDAGGATAKPIKRKAREYLDSHPTGQEE